uniref:Uncharacterized protein n=1 Tax=Meloidogyne enterolobii TaxID=390850 RepID=A0A6V7WP04_MELEN|nr:unnamed protein product [Meloidogyne enterolobii]
MRLRLIKCDISRFGRIKWNIKGLVVDIEIGHATNLHEGDYPQYIPEEGQLNFVHPAYQSGGHQPFDYSAYTHQGGFTANQENNENEGGLPDHQSHLRLFGKDIYVKNQDADKNFVEDQDATFPAYLYPSTEEEEQRMLLRAQEESARSAHFRSGNLAIGGNELPLI